MGDMMYYIRRNNKGILIKDENKEYVVETSIKKYINMLCMKNLSTYDGRKIAVKNLFEQKNNIPIFVNRNIFLYPTKSLRDYDTVFINYFSILSFNESGLNKTLFIFNNLDEIIFDISIKKVIKQHKIIEKIYQYLENVN